MKVLVDYDSLLYAALYKVLSISQMKDLLKKYDKESVRQMVILEANERLSNMCLSIMSKIGDSFDFDSTDVEYYLTSNIFSYRKKISQTYKANRTRNKWVVLLKQYIIDNENCHYSLEWESDDLIADRAKELKYDCVIATIDKDLNQIPGWKFDLYKQKTGEVSERGIEIKDYRGLRYVDKVEAKKFIWLQMLTGDTSDNIKGIKGIGQVRAEKMLSGKCMFIPVARAYEAEYGLNWKDVFRTNYRLLKIGNL
jgi:5'-3' exonuclease